MSKGSKRRPTLVDEETFEERWERTFEHPAGEPECDPLGRVFRDPDDPGLATEEDERARANGS